MAKDKSKLIIGPEHHLSIDDVEKVALNPQIKVVLSPTAEARINRSRALVEKMSKDRKVVYGVTTGFGSFKDKIIDPKDSEALQRNLIRSHSVGVGSHYAPPQVRAALLVRLNSLVQGYSGVRLEFLKLVCDLLNNNIVPLVPLKGSVGASGDLAPLSHMGLVLMGEGQAWYDGELMSGAAALKKAKLTPIVFQAKEGLAWNNGTSVMTGVSALAMARAKRLVTISDLALALTLEAICGLSNAFNSRLHQLRPHTGQIASAKAVKSYIAGSKLIDSFPERVQDSYSVRCAPQVHGAARDALAYVESVIETELNSVTDNPLIFDKPSQAISGGNFHGEPIAIAMDTFAIAVSELANISERRIAKLLDPVNNGGLPIFLMAKKHAGLNSGLMMPQYTAAALVSENKVLAHPASVDSIPTSVNQEDHVSMGSIASRKAVDILENSENVLAIELLTAAQALEFRNRKHLGKITRKLYQLIRKYVPMIESDRELHIDIKKIKTLIDDSIIIDRTLIAN